MCESGKVEEEEEEEEGLSFKDNAPLFLPFSFRPIPLYLFPHCSFPLLPPPRPTPIQCQILSLRWRGTREEEGQSRERRRAKCKYGNLFYSFAFLLASLNGGSFCYSFCFLGGLHYCEVIVLFVAFTSSIKNINIFCAVIQTYSARALLALA